MEENVMALLGFLFICGQPRHALLSSNRGIVQLQYSGPAPTCCACYNARGSIPALQPDQPIPSALPSAPCRGDACWGDDPDIEWMCIPDAVWACNPDPDAGAGDNSIRLFEP